MYIYVCVCIYMGQVQDFGNIYTYINMCPANWCNVMVGSYVNAKPCKNHTLQV